MNRLSASLLVLALACAPAACKSSASSSTSAPPPETSTRDFEGKEKIRFRSEVTDTGELSPSGPSTFDYIMVPFENVIYLPWKVVGGGFKGASDGVSAGFAKDRMPIFGAIFSPVNAIIGFGTGMVEGAALSPGLVGPEDSFGHAMGQPTRHATAIWWYQ